MTGTLVDSSVLLDVAVGSRAWSGWSGEALRRARRRGPLIINQIILAEVVVSFGGAESPLLRETALERRELPWAAAEPAGRAHAAYRARGGAREAILPDFLIGAHALVEGLALLTRDPRRVRAAFGSVEIIAP